MTQTNTGLSYPPATSTYALVDQICQRAFGHEFITVLSYRQGAAEVQRVYSSNLHDYPIGMRKPMGVTEWGKIVLEGGQSWFCDAEETIHWAFPDAEKILSLGCQAMLCVPILDPQQRTIGVLSLNGAPGAYKPADLSPLAVIAQTLLPILQQETAED